MADEVDSAMGIAQRFQKLGSEPSSKWLTSAIPGGSNGDGNHKSRVERGQRRPIAAILGFELPSMGVICTLLEEYFDSVHWFSLVIYEPRFRSKFATLQDGLAYPSQKAFLRLLSLVAAMGAWYKLHKNAIDSEFPDEDWLGWSTTLVDGVAAQLIEIMDQVSISALQLCILLGSYYVYHGKPNLSFALLGATIRTAHAMGLHYQPRLGGDVGIIEERKRVWWTIYTWDRYVTRDDYPNHS